jgi:hypothetical protein
MAYPGGNRHRRWNDRLAALDKARSDLRALEKREEKLFVVLRNLELKEEENNRLLRQLEGSTQTDDSLHAEVLLDDLRRQFERQIDHLNDYLKVLDGNIIRQQQLIYSLRERQ